MTVFLDTNVLIYALAGGDDPRRSVARDLIRSGGTISAQVLNELVSVLRGPKHGVDWDRLGVVLDQVAALDLSVRPVSEGTHARAVVIARDHGLHIYDACIVAAAQEARCTVLWTEDLQDGQRFGVLTIRNPFAAG